MIDTPKIEPREEKDFAPALRRRVAGYLPAWRPGESGADAALLAIAARYFSVLGNRLNQAPHKNFLAFLETAGLERIPAQSARAPIVFKINPQIADGRLPKQSRVAAPAPPGSNEQIIFETETDLGLAAAQLREVVSVHPGRDQYEDHSAAYLAGAPFESFAALKNTEHILYLGHQRILNLAGEVTVKVTFALAENSSERLDLMWEYWDGKVWRQFANVLERCDEEAREDLDSTNGFTRSGALLLQTGSAETKPVAVHGLENWWVRGRLLEPLPADPTQILPLVESVKLRTVINRPMQFSEATACQVTFESLPLNKQYSRRAGNNFGEALFSENGVFVSMQPFKDSNGKSVLTGSCVVEAASAPFNTGQVMRMQSLALKFDFTNLGVAANEVTFDFAHNPPVDNISVNGAKIIVKDLTIVTGEIAPGVTIQIQGGNHALLSGPVQTLLIGGENLLVDNVCANKIVSKSSFLPDKAFAGSQPLDLTKAFYPLGQQPQPGNVFYFTSAELFSKPNARAQVFIQTAATPEGNLNVVPGARQNTKKDPLSHSVVWEYWNGTDWVAFAPLSINDPTHVPEFEHSEVFSFVVPEDMAAIKINDEEVRWMRVRLVSGGYGFTANVKWTDTTSGQPNEFTYVIPQPPALANFRLGYSWESAGEAPEATLAYNDFQYRDYSEQARYPGRPFLPFNRMQDTTPGLYFGFDKKLPVDFLNLFFDIVEQRGAENFELVWEFWDGSLWRRLAAQDETGHLARPGMLSFIGPEESVALAPFGTPRHWLRGRLREDGPAPRNHFNAIHPNAVWASQRQTVRDQTLGKSNGLPHQTFRLNNFPVLAGEQIEVRELAGPLAAIEYPLLLDELDEERLRTVKDRNGKVTEVWVRWESRPHLFFSGAEDRHYYLNRSEGRLFFGDGANGKNPPANALIFAREYKAGGGKTGNVAARAIKQLLSGVAGVQEVFNALPAEGGAEAEPVAAIASRGPATLRHRGRAMTVRDYEVMAREASPEVAWVRVFAASDVFLGHRPGRVLIMILPETKDRRPWPSFGLREKVRKYLEEHALASLCATRCIYVTGPEYFPIDVEVAIVPQVASEAGSVEQRVRADLEDFLHPLAGGPAGKGWELGRDVFLSDVAAVVENISGVDFAETITLLRDNTPQGERINVPRDRLVVAGEIRIQMLLT